MKKISNNSLPFASIIILNYNGKKFLDDCLNSISLQNYPKNKYEVIFVDNASTDASVELVEELYPWVKILKLNRNYGYTGGNNRGAQAASGVVFLFLNNDTIVDKNWLLELVNIILRNSRIALCGSKIISIDNHTKIQYNGYLLHILGGVVPGYSFISDDNYENKQNNSLKNNKFQFVGSVQGAAFLIRKSVFQKLNGFDDDYFLYSDENDLCHRAWINGYYVAFSPKSKVYHYSGGTAGNSRNEKPFLFGNRLSSRLRIYYGNRNSIINILKNLESKNMFLGIFFSYIYLFVQIYILIKKKKINRIKLLIAAYIWPIRNFKKVWKKRIMIQTNRKISDEELIKKGLLLRISDLLKRISSNI